MLTLQKDTIHLTRGDSAELRVEILREDADGNRTPYEGEEGDILRFSARSVGRERGNIQKTLNAHTLVLHPADTASLCPGAYVYDIELRTAAGQIYTVVSGTLYLLPEVSQ